MTVLISVVKRVYMFKMSPYQFLLFSQAIFVTVQKIQLSNFLECCKGLSQNYIIAFCLRFSRDSP